MRLPVLCCALLLAGCPESKTSSNDPPALAQASRSLDEPRIEPGRKALSAETVLLSLVLSPDGQASFQAARRRPIAYLGSAVPVEGADHFLEIRHEGLPAPLRLPLVLGRPGEPEGPARHAWAGGGAVLRAPSFGPGTRIALMDQDRELAVTEVRE